MPHKYTVSSYVIPPEQNKPAEIFLNFIKFKE